jgi:hypothetical protein
MEVFIASTPTYSGNYKANLEGLRVQSQRHASAGRTSGASLVVGCAALAPPEHRQLAMS